MVCSYAGTRLEAKNMSYSAYCTFMVHGQLRWHAPQGNVRIGPDHLIFCCQSPSPTSHSTCALGLLILLALLTNPRPRLKYRSRVQLLAVLHGTRPLQIWVMTLYHSLTSCAALTQSQRLCFSHIEFLSCSENHICLHQYRKNDLQLNYKHEASLKIYFAIPSHCPLQMRIDTSAIQ